MDRPSHGNPLEVSAYWTPQHVDVTDAPLRYAAPKATWIDQFQRLRPYVRSDVADRMARRRLQTRAVIDPAEITVLPPIVPAAVPEHPTIARGWFDGVRAMSERVGRRRVAG